MTRFKLISLFTLILVLIPFDSYSQTKIPKSRESVSIGSYTAGCVKNSVELPIDGLGYQVIRTKRQRNYGHYKLVNFIKELTTKIKYRYSAKLLIADMAQKGGGPMLDQHNSHQTGLDVDILYLHREKGNNIYLTPKQRERIAPRSVLNSSKTKIDPKKWSWINGEVLKEAAFMNEVDRIFVNPAIKKQLCTSYGNESWLTKIRPWWGHDGHFHVRLKCPSNSSKCVPNSKLTEEIGCGSNVEWWFSKEAYLKRIEKLKSSPKTKKDITLPKECL